MAWYVLNINIIPYASREKEMFLIATKISCQPLKQWKARNCYVREALGARAAEMLGAPEDACIARQGS